MFTVIWLRKKHIGRIFGKNENQNRVYISKESTNHTKNICTYYRVLEEKSAYSLLEIELLTGRTHQIRAHMASIGHPLAGDRNTEPRY